jgi:4-azaleucine resistance transporter AzlC
MENTDLPPTTPGKEFLKGITVILPILSGVIPFGMLYGAVAVASGIPANIAMAMSPVVFAGSAQFVAIKLMTGGASALVLLFTTLVVNLRHALYGISLGTKLDYLPARWKWLLAYLLTDEAYAVTIVRTEQKDWIGKEKYTHWVFLAAALSLWVVWQISTAIGVLFGSQIPASWQLDFALPLTFIALVIPMLSDRPGIIAGVCGGVMALVFANLPLKLGLIAAVFFGILAGMLTEYFLVIKKKQIPNPDIAGQEEKN